MGTRTPICTKKTATTTTTTTTRTTTTTTTTRKNMQRILQDEKVYVEAPNSRACPSGSRALTEAECTQAARDLSLRSWGRVSNKSSFESRRKNLFPHGCYYNKNESWSGLCWNPDTPGGGASNTRTP